MFRTMPDTEPAPEVAAAADLIPLSVLALDLPEPPASGWDVYLTGRGIEVATDDIGRASIARADARQLLDEKREGEARARAVRERQEQQAVEADQRFRAQLIPGTPWWEFDGASPAEVWAAREKNSQPRRRSVLEDALSNQGTILYPIGPDGDAA